MDSGLRRQPQPPPAVVYRIVDGPAALAEGLEPRLVVLAAPPQDQLRGLVLPSGAPVIVDGVEWTDRAHIAVAVPSALADELDTALATLSAGALTATPVGERWTDYA